MDQPTLILWITATIVLAVCFALSIIATRLNMAVLGAVSGLPVLVALLLHLAGIPLDAPHPVFAGIIGLELLGLGVTVGSPLTLFILGLTESRPVLVGAHGGIMSQTLPLPRSSVSANGRVSVSGSQSRAGWAASSGTEAVIGVPEPVEILRGGATIGYLERIAVIGCIALGRVEGIAVLVAIKGLGRFSELDSPEARERFIIGTLVSLLWSCAAGALLVLTLS